MTEAPASHGAPGDIKEVEKLAVRTISTRLAIEGEDKYKQAISSCNSELAKLKSSLAATQSEYRNNANSLEALQAKGKELNALYDAQLKKLNELRAGLENARNAQRNHANAIEEYRTKISATETQLEKLKNSTEDTSEEQKQLTEELAKLKQELSEAEAKEAAATKGINNYEKQVNTAKIQLNDLSDEIEKNGKYLDEAKNSADGCAKSIDQYGKEVKDATDNSNKFGKDGSAAIDAVASALSAAGVAAAVKEIADALLSCINAAIEFESAMTGVFKTVEGSEAQLQAISDGIQSLSQSIPATTTELAGIAETAGQLGIRTDDILSFTETMANLGVATNMTAEEAATMLAQFANITQMNAEDYNRLGSAIVELGNNFATTEKRIIEMSQRIASAATVAGMSETDILALSTALSSLGVDAEAGGTAMSKLITELQTAVETGDGLTEFASAANMSAEEFSHAWSTSPVSALNSFIVGLGNSEAQGKSMIATLDELGITEVRMSNAVRAMATSGDTLGRALEVANQAWKEDIALQDEASKRYATTESKTVLLKNATTRLQTEIGNALTPAVNRLLDAGTDVADMATEIVEENPWLVSAITALTAGIGTLVVGVTGLALAVNVVIPAIQTLWAVMTAHPIGAIATAVAALIVALGTFCLTCQDSNEALEEVRETAEAAKESVEAATETYEKNTSEIEASAQVADVYIDRLEELEKQGLKTKDAQNEYRLVVEQLNTLIPDLNLVIDEQTGLIEGGTGALRLNTEEWKKNALAQAMQEKLKTIYEANNEVLIKYNESQQNLIEATSEQDAIQKQMDETYQKIADSLGITTEQLDEYGELFHILGDDTLQVNDDTLELMQTYGDLEGQLRTCEDSVYDAQEAFDEAETSMKDMEEEIYSVQDAYNQYTESLSGTNEELSAQDQMYKQIFESDLPAIQAEIDELSEKYNEAYEAAYESISQQIGLFDSMEVEYTTTVEDMLANLDTQIEYMDEYSGNINNLLSRNIEGVEDLVASFSDGSTESAEYLNALANASDEEIEEVIKQLGEVEEGKENFSKTFADINTDFDKKMSDLEKRLGETVDELNQSDEAYESASETVQGYIDGAKSLYDEVYAAYKSLADAASRAWNSNLQLSSSVPNVSSGSSGRPYAIGLAYVPYDNFPALLHKGERILNAQEAKDYLASSVPSYAREGKLPTIDYTPILSSMLAALQMKSDRASQTNIFNISGGASPNQTSKEVERLMRRMLYEQ